MLGGVPKKANKEGIIAAIDVERKRWTAMRNMFDARREALSKKPITRMSIPGMIALFDQKFKEKSKELIGALGAERDLLRKTIVQVEGWK